jgi:class 3 adenylate cyclase
MPFLDDIVAPIRGDLMVAFIDLALWSRWARARSDEEAFERLSHWYAFVDGFIASSGGRCVKCIGDAVLTAHPLTAASDAVRALARLKQEGDAWLARQMPGCHHQIKVHAGSMLYGPLGPPSDRRLDLIGEVVNACASLPTHGLALSVPAFRALDPEARRLFKKHTPPITYIPLAERHKEP